MGAEPIQWSEEKQQHLQSQLVGRWSEDIWEVGGQNGKKRYLRFFLTSSSLKAELKYALWYKFDSGARDVKKSQNQLYCDVALLVAWLNRVAPTSPSLLDKPLEYWEWSLRSYLIETKRFRPHRFRHLIRTQKYVEGVEDDSRIGLFRQCYKIIADVYDDREEVEKDCWDMRKMGLAINLTISSYLLNFTSIAQPWLKHMAKEFVKYNMAVHSPGDCSAKLTSIRVFSQFLTEYIPSNCCISDMNRTLIVAYMSFLQKRKLVVRSRNQHLIQLRVFLEVCVYHLQVPGLTKEQLIFDDDLAKEPEPRSREIPSEILEQLRDHLQTLPTTLLRMVTILLECGLRINELCSLPLGCLIHDDRNEWFLRFYQRKTHKEHVIPLVNDKVVGTIQAQQLEVREAWGEAPYLFPSHQSHLLPYKQTQFYRLLNLWAVQHEIKDAAGKFYHFTAHQFRHTVGMQLLDEDVPLEVISRLLGHRSLRMTQVYARVKEKKLRAELERVALKRKTVNAQGQAVKGDARANAPEAQMVRRGMRGQTLPVGGCGRLVVLGDCAHANKCLTCPMWLTSTEDLSSLTSFYERAVRLRQRAIEAGNQFVIEQQERIIANLAIRIKSLEETSMDGSLAVHEVLEQLQADLAEAESALEEAREYGLIPAAKYLERTITDLKARIAALEESL